jgi:orotate phosphoribosyltransferase
MVGTNLVFVRVNAHWLASQRGGPLTYDLIAELSAIGALKRGHFLLASGRHSDQYVEKFDLLRQAQATQRACTELIARLGNLTEVDLVVGPTTGGILLAFEIGRQLGLPAAYAERVSEGSSKRAFKRGTVIEPGTRVLVVDDVLTTGGSVRETLAALDQVDACVRAVALLVDRSTVELGFTPPLISLGRLDIGSWPAQECPLCLAGQELVKPGSTAGA